MDFLMNIGNKLNDILWSTPLPLLCLTLAVVFTIYLKGFQVRKLKSMVTLLFSGKASERGLSSFQAFALAIAGRVGTGNIVGVATGIAYGGPGALFWMWMTAIFGAAIAFVESTMAQLYKEDIGGEYRGGAAYYIRNGLNNKFFGNVFAISIVAASAIFLTGVQANAIATSVGNSFNVPNMVTGVIVCILTAVVCYRGSKKIGRFAELVVPFMATIYIIMAVYVIIVKIDQLPVVFSLIMRNAFGKEAILGGMLGSTFMWGVKRAVYSSEVAMGTATQSAAAAEVSHPVKQGLVQSFSVYIDTLFVCTATGLVILLTDSYNVIRNGEIILQNIGDIGPSAVWTQIALAKVIPFADGFVAIALFFFAFTTIMNMYYNCETNLAYFYKNGLPSKLVLVLRVVYTTFVFLGTVLTADAVWALADVGIGVITWVNAVSLIFLLVPTKKLLDDFESQQKLGVDPVFDPDKVDIKNVPQLWREIRDGFLSGSLQN